MSDAIKSPQLRLSTLDTVEKAILIPLYLVFCYRMIHGWLDTGSVVPLLYLGDQLVVLIFILVRRAAKDVSIRVDDWLFGLAGTFLPLLLAPPSANPVAPPAVFVLLLAAGFAMHVSAKFTLRRSFGVVAANRGVKASGPYRLVRHPMYLGYMLSHLGVLLAGPSLFNAAVIAACWTLFVLRILAEERILLLDEAYGAFAARTRYRLLPGVF